MWGTTQPRKWPYHQVVTTAIPLRREHHASVPTGWIADTIVVVLTATGTLLSLANGGIGVSHQGSRRLTVPMVMLAAASAVPLLARRVKPFEVLVVTGIATALIAAIGAPNGLLLGPGIALYSVAVHRDRVRVGRGLVAATVTAMLAAYLIATVLAARTRFFPGVELFHGALLWATCWFAGERARLRREQIAELKREAQRERILAATEERARIARDLHDSAGHAINVIAVRAGAARLRHHEDPARSLAALTAIEQLARNTVADLDHLVGMLRSTADHDPVSSPIGIASLPILIAQHTDAGHDVTFRTVGAARPVRAALDQAAFRIVQEALTNASRHGTGPATVELAFNDDAIALAIDNPATGPAVADGYGLVGMRERATGVGGTLAVERTPTRFTLRAILPYAEQAR